MDSLIDMPGASSSNDGSLVLVPNYLNDGFSIYSIDQDESAYNYLDILGMYVKIDNYNISNGKPGDITKKIINLYNNYICKNKITLSKELKIA